MNYTEAKNKIKAYLIKQAMDVEDAGAAVQETDPRLLAAMAGIPLAGMMGMAHGGTQGLAGAGMHGLFSKAHGQAMPRGIWPGMKTAGKYGAGIGAGLGLGVGGLMALNQMGYM